MARLSTTSGDCDPLHIGNGGHFYTVISIVGTYNETNERISSVDESFLLPSICVAVNIDMGCPIDEH